MTPIETYKLLTENQINTIHNLIKNGIRIYYDMDNTICLFCAKGHGSITLEKVYEKDFFKNLAPIDNCIEVIHLLVYMGVEVFIITACVDSKYCKKEKKQWLKQYLPCIKKKNIILCKIGENKADFAENIKKSILVDDYGENLKNWIDAGGIAFKKSYSHKKREIPVVRNHMDIFTILENLDM